MRHERQVELLERVAASGADFVGLHGDHSMVNPATVTRTRIGSGPSCGCCSASARRCSD